MNHISIRVIALIFLITSCNRDSNELALPALPLRQEIKKQVTVNGKDLLEVIIHPPRHIGDEPAIIFLRNISGSDIVDASIILEVCDANPNYENCRRYQLFEALNLKEGIRSVIGKLEGLTVSDETVFNIFLSKYAGKTFLPEGASGNDKDFKLDGLATFFKNNEIVAYGKSTAYLQVDGTLMIRLLSFDLTEGITKYYNVAGQIVQNRLIIGTLSTDLTPSHLVPLLPESTFQKANSLVKVKDDYQPFSSIQITHL